MRFPFKYQIFMISLTYEDGYGIASKSTLDKCRYKRNGYKKIASTQPTPTERVCNAVSAREVPNFTGKNNSPTKART